MPTPPKPPPVPDKLPAYLGQLSVDLSVGNGVGVWGIASTNAKMGEIQAAGPQQSGAGFFNGHVGISAEDQSGLSVSGPATGVGAGLVLQAIGGNGWEILATGQASSQGAGKFN